MKKILEKIKEWFESLFKKKPDPEPTPQYGKLEAENNFSHPAKITASMTMKRLERDRVWYDVGERIGWQTYQGDLTGEVWCGVWRDGWKCAKFDHVRNNTRDRELKHMYHHDEENPAYGDWKQIGGPIPGEKVCFFIIDYPHQQRTEAIFGVLP